MLLPDPQFARSDVLRIFNHSQVYLFLGTVITTVGILAAAFSLQRRRLDPLLLWFALFAVLYGVRLEIHYQLLWALGLHPEAFRRLENAIGYLLPIPAFLFFRTMNLLGRAGTRVSNIVWPIFLCLALATLIVGHREIFRYVNNGLVVTVLIVIAVVLIRAGAGSPEVNLIRAGLFIFFAGAIYDNITGIVGIYYNVEPFTFLVLLAVLGIVAGRRTLANEQQLTDIRKELDIARGIQLSILPTSLPASGSFQIAARYLPMTSVAGDFYDFFEVSDHETGVLIADVSGHGVPAALIASMVKLAATTQRAKADSPADVLQGMNSALCGNTQGQFVTAGYVYLNSISWELRYSAAAHPPMLLLRDGAVTEISENGLMLAAFPFATYATVTYSIKPGDRIFLYTDGLLEAANAKEEEFGPSRLQALIRETGQLPALAAVDRIISSIQEWSVAQNDDLTVLLCDCVAQAGS